MDRDLIERIAAGDRNAMQALYGRHNVRIFRFILRRLRNEAVAEELTSEVFLEVWRQAGRYEGRSTVSTWMMAIANNKAMSQLRRKTEAPLEDEMTETLAAEDDDPEQAAQKKDKGELLRTCIEKLSPDHAQVIDLVYYHDKSVKEVSEIAGIPEATVKTRMHYARKQLSEILQAAGVDRGWP